MTTIEFDNRMYGEATDALREKGGNVENSGHGGSCENPHERNTPTQYVAHSGTSEHPDGQPLKEHLESVSHLAASFLADPFLSRCAALCGLYHDAGKYKHDVQRHIQESNNERVDHATMGGILLNERSPEPYKPCKTLLTAPILGHHGGIPNAVRQEQRRSIEDRLRDPLPQDAARAFDREMGEAAAIGDPPKPGLRATRETLPFEWYMAARMVHSALVDADFLDTERFYDPEQAELRGKRPALAGLVARYEAYMRALPQKGSADIHRIRAEIQAQCVRAAGLPQGFFSLSVPTGGGKTLSSLGFALNHAARHGNIRRIIYAIPFTSIIEQNADVFRGALGEDAVLEHHSAVAPPEEGTRTDRASENWDAPLVVTTNVQLFESLFSNKPSTCRKLHRLQDSVIILDEMQALSDALLRPCLMALCSLVRNYRATVVICTATQPNYDGVWPDAPQVTEIIPNPAALFESMRRTRVEYLGALEDDALVDRLLAHEQVLCIVNNRAHAQGLYRALGGEENGAYHLSTMMCAEHRRSKLAVLRARLEAGERVRLVSTSLIEAGVDVDFPAVYRAIAGVDSIAQAAGRCNRGGHRPDPAPVYVFTPVGMKTPPETERLGSITLSDVAPKYDDLLSREAIAKFFAIRFGAGADLDAKHILRDIAQQRDLKFAFETIANRFQMIQSAGEPLFIPYDGEARALLERLRGGRALGSALRKLQRYGVTIYAPQKKELIDKGCLQVVDGALILDASEEQLAALYTDEYGLAVGAALTLLDY